VISESDIPAVGVPRQPWSDAENDMIVADYLSMLAADIAKEPFSKSEHRSRLSELLPARNHKAIEFKHLNISAVMLGLGQPMLTGYVPAANFQLSLVDAVLRQLDAQPHWHQISKNAPQSVSDVPGLWIGPAPHRRNEPPPINPELLARVAQKYDVAARDERNRELGRAGEELVLEHEKRRLHDLGASGLAKRVRWVADLDGDGAGYDIASWEAGGTKRLIEVKTTNGWERTPFHISANEVAVANAERAVWRLVRLYDFARVPKAFELLPPLEQHVELTPTSFLAQLH
jgi:hypothetical protein